MHHYQTPNWRNRRAGEPVTAFAGAEPPGQPDDPDDEPDDLEPELTDPGGPEVDDPLANDDSYWDVFIPDDDQCDPLPEPGDFWMEESQESRVESHETEGQVVICQ